MPSSSGSQVLRGMADSGGGSPLVAITSLIDMPQHVVIRCLEARGVAASKSVSLSAGETLLTPACTSETGHGLDFDAYQNRIAEKPFGPVGISLSSDAMPGSFAAFGLTPHVARDSQYFSSVSFSDPKMTMSDTTVFTGVPVGLSPLLPDGKYVPTFALSNFSGKAVHVSILYAATSDDSPRVKKVRPLVLPPQSSEQISLEGLKGDPGLQNSFIVEADGNPGDVVAKFISKGHSALHEVELLGKDLDDPMNGGNHPWTVANGTRSTLLLFNTSAKSQYFNVEISAGTTVWRKAYLLQPKQTMAISVNDLMNSAAKDDSGNALPSDIWSGQIAWHMPAKDAGRGRLLESNREAAMARNFSCGYIAEVCEADYFGYANFIIDGQVFEYGVINPQVCLNTCYGTPAGPGGYGYLYNWSVNDSNIASVSGSSSDQSVSLYGASVGSTYLGGWVADDYCLIHMPSQPAPVIPQLSLSGPGTVPLAAAGTQGAVDKITLTATGTPSGGAYSWSVISGTSYIQLSSTSGSSITVTSIAAGSAQVEVGYTYNGQSAQSQIQTVTVQKPTSLVATDPGTTTQNYTCLGQNGQLAYYGDQRSVTYETMDQTGNTPIPNSGMPAAESFTPSGTNTCNETPTPQNGQTTNGGLVDNFHMCSSVCLPADANYQPLGSCQAQFTHTWTVNGFQVFNHTLTYTCTSITPQ